MSPTDEHTLSFLIALTRIEGIGSVNAQKLLQHFNEPEEIFRAGKRELQSIAGIGGNISEKIISFKNFDLIEKEIRVMKLHGIQFTTLYDNEYPEFLKHCCDAPLFLFKRGNIALENKKIISIVGTRKITSRGIDFIGQLLEELCIFDPVIVSGYAYGADIHAHLGAIKNKLQTVAVLGHGLHTTYPKSHYKYNNQMEENGGFLSEFLTSDPVNRENFIRRNRIIAGLSQATLVIESAQRGGSLITAAFANDYNRDVFALPGRSNDAYSEGCNYLIKTHRANLFTTAQDVVSFLNWEVQPSKNTAIQQQLFIALTEEEQLIYDYLKGKKGEAFDFIARDNKIAVHRLHAILLNMELKGVLRTLPGRFFELA